jgi:nitroreductase
METLKAIAERYSARKFSDKPVPRDVLEQMVDAGHRAPTARNEQPWAFVVVTDAEALKIMGGMTDHGRFIADGTACIAVVCQDGKYYLEDGSAATENILLAATDLGVQSCWVAGDKKPYANEIMQFLQVPETYRLVSLIALGYADTAGHPKEKKDVDEMIHWEKW